MPKQEQFPGKEAVEFEKSAILPKAMIERLLRKGNQEVEEVKNANEKITATAKKADTDTEIDPETKKELAQKELAQIERSADQSLADLESDLETIKTEQLAAEFEKMKKAEELREKVLEQFFSIKDLILSEDFENPEQKKEAIQKELRKLMKAMYELSQIVDPLDKDTNINYVTILETMEETVNLKKEVGEELSDAFSEIFYEFNDFIEDEVVTYLMDKAHEAGETVYAEQLMQAIYGRTKKEIEKIKGRNRKKVVEEINQMAEQPYISVEMIQKLHQVNNRAIVPKIISKLRQKGISSFGKRIGAMPEEVEPEMNTWVSRANQLIDERALGLNRRLYEITVADLHNEMLDMHPFADRNGSTALLFVEMMMAKEGYKPPEKREKNYYKTVRRALRNNFVAMGVIGYEHFLIKNVPGHYEPKISLTKEAKAKYDNWVKVLKMRQKKRKQEKKAA